MDNALAFKATCLWFALRDRFSPPDQILREAGLQPGFHVLDYGCGPGSYTLAAAAAVGPSGKVYAADINPLAGQHVQRVALSKGLRNVETILTDCATGLDAASVDVVLLYDTYHDLADPASVLAELHRVLKPGATLSFSDHHLTDDEIRTGVAGSGLFRLSGKGTKTYSFTKEGQ